MKVVCQQSKEGEPYDLTALCIRNAECKCHSNEGHAECDEDAPKGWGKRCSKVCLCTDGKKVSEEKASEVPEKKASKVTFKETPEILGESSDED